MLLEARYEFFDGSFIFFVLNGIAAVINLLRSRCFGVFTWLWEFVQVPQRETAVRAAGGGRRMRRRPASAASSSNAGASLEGLRTY